MQSTPITEEQYSINKSELGNLSIKDLAFKYIRFLPVFVLSIALALFGAYIYLRYATPVYRASGSIMIKNNQGQGGAGDQKLNQLFLNEGTQNIQNEIEVIKSRPLMQRVVDSLNLNTSYYAVGKIKSPNIYKQGPFLLKIFEVSDSARSFVLRIKFLNINQFTVNGEKGIFGFGQLFKNNNGVFRLDRNIYGALGKEYIVSWTPTTQTAASLAGGVQVTPKPATGILVISLETPNAQLSADVINRLMTEYGEQTREDKNKEAKQTLDFIDIRMDTLEVDIARVQRILLDYKIRNNLILPDAQTTEYFSKITEADRVINEEVQQMNIAGMIEEYLRDNRNGFNTVPSPLGLNDPSLASFINAYNLAQLQHKRLIDANTPAKNPLVRENEQAIEKLRMNILETIKNLKASINLTIDATKSKSGVAESQLKSLPSKVKEVAQIQTQLDSKMGLYKYLMEKREETSISLASTTPNSNVIDPAFASSDPVKPNKKSIRLLALLIGIGLPAIFIFTLEIINDKISTRFDIEKITSAPILGEIGHSYADNTLVVSKNNRSMVAEQFRIIRSNLQYVLTKVSKPVIMVTSSFSGEGKSFVTTNLGAVMALAGKKTIVLEFDIRKPKIMAGLGIGKRPGITNFLLGKIAIEELPVLMPDHENLYILSCGPVPPNPSELLLDPRVEDLFNYLRQNFDVILIDTAPVGMVSDAMTLSKFADCTLYIVRQGHTYKKQIALIDEFYRLAKIPKVSIVINDVKVKPGYGYYGYGRYGYGYGYTSGYYEEEHPPQSFLSRFFGRFDPRKAKKRNLKKS